MIIISYNFSPALKASLLRIDNLRKKILTTPVSPKTLLWLQHRGLKAHLQGWASLTNQSLSETQIQEVIDQSFPKSPNVVMTKALNYKRASNHLWQEWSANSDEVTYKTILAMGTLLGVAPSIEAETTSLLTYLQTSEVHPIIQAATTHLYFYPNRLSYVASLLFLYKSGYDLNHCLSLEDYWSRNKEQYLAILQNSIKTSNLSPWLEYYCEAIEFQMEKIFETIAHPNTTQLKFADSLKALTDRQKHILESLNTPGSSITNKKVQQEFKISQITASRDLARLSSLGLLLPQGKGRSTSYALARSF